MKLQQLIKLNMPDSPGVYTFRDYKKRPIYIGRATSLRDRVKSYFKDDLILTRGQRLVDMIDNARSLTWEKTDSVLEAILLESALIKRYQPVANIAERDDKSSLYVVITEESWPRVFLARARDLEHSLSGSHKVVYSPDHLSGPAKVRSSYPVMRYFGPFIEAGLVKVALRILRRMFPFRDKKSADPRHEEFYRALGQSPSREGEDARKKYMKTIRHLIMFFEGKKGKLRKKIEREMKAAAKEMRFEEAQEAKRLLYALDHINDIALIKESRLFASKLRGLTSPAFRIEAYDIAHISGTSVVGAMVVASNGQLDNSEYRKFKVRVDANNDAAALAEVLYRRLNHSEWQYPDIIVVDGNEVQKGAAESVLKARRIDIPVVAVTKDKRHRASRLIGTYELVNQYSKIIIAANAEAHRFALAYHRKRRTMAQLPRNPANIEWRTPL